MSKSEDVKRVLNQAVERANWIEQMEQYKDLLLRTVSDKQKVIDMLELKVEFEKSERISQERKSGAVLYFGLLAMVIYFAILGVHVFVS